MFINIFCGTIIFVISIFVTLIIVLKKKAKKELERKAENERITKEEERKQAAKEAKLLKEAGEKLQEARIMCVEKGVNLFDYIAVAEQDEFMYLVQNVTVEDIKREWSTKKPLQIWDQESWHGCAVLKVSTRSFQEYDELFDIVGARWFSDEAKEDYVQKAPDGLTKVLLSSSMDVKLDNATLIKIKGPTNMELIEELATAKSIMTVDTIGEHLFKRIERSDYHLFNLFAEKFYEAKIRILRHVSVRTFDKEELKIIAKEAIQIFYNMLGKHPRFIDEDTMERLEEKFKQLYIQNERKLYSFINDPCELLWDKEEEFVKRRINDEWISLQDNWFLDNIDACTDHKKLKEFRDKVYFHQLTSRQRERYEEYIKRRSDEIYRESIELSLQ